MRVSLSPEAEDDLWSIWSFNVDRYGSSRANDYVSFIRRGIGALVTDHPFGHPVEGFPRLRSTAFRRNPRGDGHLAVYEVDSTAGTVTVLRVFHTKQDVPGRLRG